VFDLSAWIWGLGVIVVIAVATWLVSLVKRDASIIDPVWSLLFIAAAVAYAVTSGAPGGARRGVILVLVIVWGLRLSGFLLVRNWGEPEDKRYQAMRERTGPRFPLISLVKVFLFQGLLAWLISLPLLAAVDGEPGLGWLDAVGIVVWLVGFVFEAGGDWQLARFKADPANAGRVMDRGLWRYTRHPNYFGDFTQWWGYFLIGLAAGGWWAIPGPLIMSVLLLRVSGVSLLEKGLEKSRPGYAEYVARTNAFFPGPPRNVAAAD
jgi:steroid 5-alpha reductase family enzyme